MEKDVTKEFEKTNLNFKTLSSDIAAINKILGEHSEAIKKLQKANPKQEEIKPYGTPPSGGLLE